MDEVLFTVSPLLLRHLTVHKVISNHREEQNAKLRKVLFTSLDKLHRDIHGDTTSCAVSSDHDSLSVNAQFISPTHNVFEDCIRVIGWQGKLRLWTKSVATVDNHTYSVTDKFVAFVNARLRRAAHAATPVKEDNAPLLALLFHLFLLFQSMDETDLWLSLLVEA